MNHNCIQVVQRQERGAGECSSGDAYLRQIQKSASTNDWSRTYAPCLTCFFVCVGLVSISESCGDS